MGLTTRKDNVIKELKENKCPFSGSDITELQGYKATADAFYYKCIPEFGENKIIALLGFLPENHTLFEQLRKYPNVKKSIVSFIKNKNEMEVKINEDLIKYRFLKIFKSSL